MTPTRGPKIATRGAEKTFKKRRFGQISRFPISAISRFSCTVEKAARPGKIMRQFLYVRFYVYLRVLYLHTYLRTYLHVFTCIYVQYVLTCIYVRFYMYLQTKARGPQAFLRRLASQAAFRPRSAARFLSRFLQQFYFAAWCENVLSTGFGFLS